MLDNHAKILLVTSRKKSGFRPDTFGYSNSAVLFIHNKDNLDKRQLRGIGWDLVILEGVTLAELKLKDEDAYHAIMNGCHTNKVTPIEL